MAASCPPIIDRRQVFERLRQLNVSKACHPRDLPPRLINEFAYEISEPLTVLFNLCLRSGCFPDAWKDSSVCPIPKGSRVTGYDQLRPISITPILARLFEGFLADWVMEDIKPLVDSHQFGNMKGSSVDHYLVGMLDHIHKGLDRPGLVANVCAIDFG
eukprot:XP_011666455.1 PREDICTED: RNA-directed DNA polymerase from mobile element jockey-like [Strongylocentrotus purpuratus]